VAGDGECELRQLYEAGTCAERLKERMGQAESKLMGAIPWEVSRKFLRFHALLWALETGLSRDCARGAIVHGAAFIFS
jgi:hypothetical protein